MLFANICYITAKGETVENAYVGTKGDRIAYIGATKPTEDFGQVYDGAHKLLLPGFINTHSHIPMTLLRGHGEGLSLHDWLHKKVFPFEALLTPEDVYWASQLGMAEMLRSGTTSFTDMYDFCDDIARAAVDSGIKANISRGTTNFNDDNYPQGNQGRRETIELYKNYHGAGKGRVQIEFSIHAEYTSTKKNARDIADLAKEYGVGIHTHLSETQREHDECKQRHGQTPAQFMQDCGIFDSRTVVAHCVAVEPQDIEIMAKHDVHVAHNPVSNMKLGSGVAPVRKMLDAGINVALGTDGASSNNNLDMIKEARIGLLAQSVISRSHTELLPEEMFAMATVNGAKLQARPDTGEIKLGNKADLFVIDLNQPHLTPIYNPIHHLFAAASGSDVVLTMVDGVILYKNGVLTTIDVERAMAEVRASSARILGQLQK